MRKLKFMLILVFILVVFPIFAATEMPSDMKIKSAADSLGVPFNDLKSFVSKYYTSSSINNADIVLETMSEIVKFNKEAEGNPISFFQKYGNKCVELKNVRVDKIGRRNDNGYYIKLYKVSVEGYYDITVYVGEAEAKKVSALNSNSVITVRGFIKKESNRVFLEDSTIVKY